MEILSNTKNSRPIFFVRTAFGLILQSTIKQQKRSPKDRNYPSTPFDKLPEKRGTFNHGRSIEERPHKVETRQEFGHFEADTVLSGKRKGQAVATFVERKSRLTIVKRLHGRDSQSMTQAVLELASQLQDKLKTLTVDYGKEFANYQTIERQTGTQVYFAHAYSPHERGSNENRNRVLRRFIPKGQAIEELSDRQLVQINWYLNSRPLKCLNWHTPIEIFLLNLRH